MNETPEFLRTLLSNQYGDALTEKIIAGYAETRPVTLRVNRLKTDASSVKKQLTAAAISFREAESGPDALIVENVREAELKQTDLYRRGEIYLQSLSSMLPPLVLGAQAGENVLDMTAAPGGKTTQISALTGGKAMITACERDKIRAGRLRYNVEKQGAPRVTVIECDASALDDFFRFDKILLDAPCSGSGTVNLRVPVKISPKLIENCARMQEKLLAKALRLLKRGSTMVYSTCSVLRSENESILEKVLPAAGAEIVPVEGFSFLPLLPSLKGTLCVMPDRLYEGFFVAKIMKK